LFLLRLARSLLHGELVDMSRLDRLDNDNYRTFLASMAAAAPSDI
jgi:hypothetical protein